MDESSGLVILPSKRTSQEKKCQRISLGPANLKPWPVPSDVVTVCDF